MGRGSPTEKGRYARLGDKESRDVFLKWVAIHAENRKKRRDVRETEEGAVHFGKLKDESDEDES
jgi:hypothetical protein